MIDAINRAAEAIDRSNNSIDYTAIVSAVCSVISLVRKQTIRSPY